jgi:hypothetical protein
MDMAHSILQQQQPQDQCTLKIAVVGTIQNDKNTVAKECHVLAGRHHPSNPVSENAFF